MVVLARCTLALPVLESTPVPILELWGDRGAGPQSLESLHIPHRPNIEVHWIAGATHWMLLSKGKELAALMNTWLGNSEAPGAR